ncbi:putative E3 ubiquitin-protein ligase TRIML1 [Phascolarctos cinereus]|uniref:Probable E3 ubiquitin-protein ligase TRIML1 n=1 Tax=Phascolarctos cinereus TaxID=38626 RepID=A0A6P5M2M5_PHACI|nr:probable E3 ubiquitin-protein ligase TRIML1 [Phascolarctos cinereus]
MDAKNLLENLKVEITCFMCFSYFTNPVIVKCGHTFCKECLLNCWKEAHKPITCPNCKAIIKFGDFLPNRRLQNLAIIGKMLAPHLLQSITDLTICEKHGKEETLFCEEDCRPLCGPCFLTTEHKDHKVLPLEKAAGQCMEKLQATWNILKSKKEKFQMELEWGEMRVAQWEVEGQSLKDLVVSEYEKMHQFFLEEEQLQLQRLNKETRDNMSAEESKASQAQATLNLPMNSEEQPVQMIELEGQAMKQSIKSEFEKKYKFLSEEKQLSLQKLDQEVKDNLAKFVESKAKVTQHIHDLQTAMSEIEKTFEKLPVEMLQDLPHNPKRFELILYVLATQSFTSGKHYWEVEVGNTKEWEVGICKESIRRKRNGCRLPEDTITLGSIQLENNFLLLCSNQDVHVSRPIHKTYEFADYLRSNCKTYTSFMALFITMATTEKCVSSSDFLPQATCVQGTCGCTCQLLHSPVAIGLQESSKSSVKTKATITGDDIDAVNVLGILNV